MDKHAFKKSIASIEKFPQFFSFFKWLFISAIAGVLCGSASAFFLVLLEWATNWRENHIWIIAFLPIGGLAIGFLYYYFGSSVVKGNNMLLEEFHTPKQVIPFRMAPLVLLGTVVTHFFGGSAGREGTAIQMGGAIADQFTNIFKMRPRDRKILIIIGISGGFASVFGTPLAGAVFALEVLIIGRMCYEAILLSFLTAAVAHYTSHWWGVEHTQYKIPFVPEITFFNLLLVVAIGIAFGLTAMLFSRMTDFWGEFFKLRIQYPPLRPFIGGIIIAITVFAMGTTKYIGLGIPYIVDAFKEDMAFYDFLLKILLTSFTLGAGFKGGEVTPLFFIGAMLGNALAFFVPLPLALMAAMGFVAVFAGATNTPLACTIMGIELFGIESSIYIAISCVTAYLFSGHTGIYSSQIIGGPKKLLFGSESTKSLESAGKERKKILYFRE